MVGQSDNLWITLPVVVPVRAQLNGRLCGHVQVVRAGMFAKDQMMTLLLRWTRETLRCLQGDSKLGRHRGDAV